MKIWCVGAGSGIGLASAEALLRNGHDVTITGKSDADVRNYPALEGKVERCGPFGGVVYSAGINELNWMKDLRLSDMEYIFSTNVFGFTNVMRAMLNGQDVPARVVVVTSDAAVRPMRGSLAYCASKAALDMAVKVAARELGPTGWRVNAVAPGMTEPTEMQKVLDAAIPEFRGWTPDEALAYELGSNPLGRRAHTMEVADLIASVIDMPDYVNGSTFTINGGR